MSKQTINVGATANDKQGDSLRAAFQKVNANFTELYTALGLADDTTLNLGAFEFSGSTMSTTDSTAIVIDQAVTVNSNLTVGGDLLPQTANGGDLGSSLNPWRSLYVSNNTIYIGGTAVGVDANGNLTTGGTVVGSSPAWASITGKPTFATVATSGAYGDLSGRPTIPTLTSQLTNDSGFLTTAVLSNGLDADLKGSVFGDDSSILVDGVNGVLRANVDVGAGNIWSVTAENKTWSFDYVGGLTFPNGHTISTSSDFKIQPANGTLLKLGNPVYAWDFDISDGSLTFPGGMTIETEYGGGARLVIDGKGNFVDIRDSGNILIGYNSTGNVQIGNPEGGTLTEIVSEKVIFLLQAVPATSIGVAGDSAGRVAFDTSYIYYCTGLYDGVTNIWKRVAWSADTW